MSAGTICPAPWTEGAILITGGAGFIGSNLADALLRTGWPVVLFDNLSRAGVERNAAWLRRCHGDRVRLVQEDVRDAGAVRRCIESLAGAGAPSGLAGVFHLAAQVAVTSSLIEPVHDFAVNAGGTLNVLEALRGLPAPPPLLFTSTNKVYGGLSDLMVRREGARYRPVDDDAGCGVAESRPLDFHSPYGCSKGAADQYVLDYARTYGLPATVFRMSCIYGPHQHGTEDQGWIAHFLIRTLQGAPLILYGDGCQVRDALFVEDLVRAMALAFRSLASSPAGPVCGHPFNIGGGPERTISLLELVELIGTLTGTPPAVRFGEWRPGDQRYYVSDTRSFTEATGWVPRVGVREGVARLAAWLREASGDLRTTEGRAGAGRRAAGRHLQAAPDGMETVTSKPELWSDVPEPEALPVTVPAPIMAADRTILGAGPAAPRGARKERAS